VRYWWVNQKKTYRHEVPGGYMWSPQRNNNGSYSQFYENMREVEPGDYVLSYAGGEIRALGVALSAAYESPKPEEFGPAGLEWSDLGWRVDVAFQELEPEHRLRPKDYLEELWPLAPAKYSPIQSNGNSVTAYLFEMPEAFANVLLSRVESALEWRIAQALQQNDIDLRLRGEERVEEFLKRAPLEETVKQALIEARRGQGRFRQGVSYVEPACRFTGVRNPALLVASHIQPWHRCHTNGERLDPFNGLLLTPTYDRLFDRGFVTFSPEHRLLISPRLPVEDIRKIRMDPDLETEPFKPEQQKYLAYHREHVFRAA
jgi:putative restriction endonuclease